MSNRHNVNNESFNVANLPDAEVEFMVDRIEKLLKRVGSNYDASDWSEISFSRPWIEDPSSVMDLFDELEKYRIVFSSVFDTNCFRLTCFWLPAVGSPIQIQSGRGTNLCSAFASIMLDTTPNCMFDRIDSTGLRMDPIQ